LPELALIEGNEQVATKSGESLSPSLFTFRLHFPSIHRNYYYIFTTVEATATDAPFSISPTGNFRVAHQEVGQIT
jgi:hypothetical protein